MRKDTIHYSPRRIDSHNKPFNFITSEREAGKTTAILATKIYKEWYHHHRPSIILRRQIVDITETYITDLQDAINDFLPEKKQIEFQFRKGNIKEGIVDVLVRDKPFCRFIAMSCPKSRIKSLRYDDPYLMIMDEFIVDNRNGEKYLVDEANKFKEIYNTFNRFATRHGHILKCYFCGNPYSVYNPYYVWLNVDLAQIKPGAFIVGSNYAIECYQITQELRDFIKKNNPLYEFDDADPRYAFGGQAINDQTFEIQPKQPEGYRLRHIFRLQNRYLYVYWNNNPREGKFGVDYGRYWIMDKDSYDGSKTVRAIDFNNLVAGTELVTSDIKLITFRLKQAIGSRDVTYSSIGAGYLTEIIYTQI